MKPVIIPVNITGKERLDFIVKNEALILHSKKSEIKHADSTSFKTMYIDGKGTLVSKAEATSAAIDTTKLKVVVVINTTNWFDSHGDVHIPGLWKKSLSDNKSQGFYLLDSHNRCFEDVITDGCKGEAKLMTWKELGYNLAGNTEALIFTGTIDKNRNKFMFDQYQAGYVKQHSVGMQYVKMVTCINDEDYPIQKENWDKYRPMVVNSDDVDEDGYFWAILEAKVIEGSAVLFGSNSMTPTISIGKDTSNQPPLSTGNKPSINNKAKVACPNCECTFDAPDEGSCNCPDCGQYVSPQSTSIETSFDLSSAIAGTTFIN